MNFPFEHVDIQGRGMCELILPFTLVEITQILWEEGLNLAVCALPTIQQRMLSFASRSIPASLTTDPPQTLHTRRREKKKKKKKKKKNVFLFFFKFYYFFFSKKKKKKKKKKNFFYFIS